MAGPVIGLALGSGGARGWCHIGVLRGLEELGIRPDVIAGASMGAIVGAAYAAGKLDVIEEWALSITRRKFLAMLDVRLSGGGLVLGKAILNLPAELGLPEYIEDLAVPFRAVASDMQTGREVWLKRGNLAEALRASSAVPGLLGPARIKGKWLLDGGLTNPVPVSVARAMGAEIIIAVNAGTPLGGSIWSPDIVDDQQGILTHLAGKLPKALGAGLFAPPEGPRSPGYLTVVSSAIEMMVVQILRARLAGDPPHVLLNGDPDVVKTLELYNAALAIEEGRRMVARHKVALLNLLEG